MCECLIDAEAYVGLFGDICCLQINFFSREVSVYFSTTMPGLILHVLHTMYTACLQFGKCMRGFQPFSKRSLLYRNSFKRTNKDLKSRFQHRASILPQPLDVFTVGLVENIFHQYLV